MPYHPTLTSSSLHHSFHQWTALFYHNLQCHLNDHYFRKEWSTVYELWDISVPRKHQPNYRDNWGTTTLWQRYLHQTAIKTRGIVNPFNAELLGTLASPMSDLYEDNSRILAYEQIITREGVVLYWWITPRSCQGHIMVISRSNSQKYWKYPLFQPPSPGIQQWGCKCAQEFSIKRINNTPYPEHVFITFWCRYLCHRVVDVIFEFTQGKDEEALNAMERH